MAEYNPLPVFHFRVSWGGVDPEGELEEVAFAEVSGLNIENQVIEYRHGARTDYGAVKIPGIPKYGNITMKKGIVPKDNKFFEWMYTIKLNKVVRKTLMISLLDETHQPVMTWKATNAFPVKIEGPSLKATGNEVAIESIEVAHEGLSIENE